MQNVSKDLIILKKPDSRMIRGGSIPYEYSIYRKLKLLSFLHKRIAPTLSAQSPGGEYPDGDPPGDMDPGKLKRCPLGPFIPGPFGILGWNLAGGDAKKATPSVFFWGGGGGTTRGACVFFLHIFCLVLQNACFK